MIQNQFVTRVRHFNIVYVWAFRVLFFTISYNSGSKPFSTATQFLERHSIATHVDLLNQKSSSKEKKYFYLLLNIILEKTRSISHNEACVIGTVVFGCCLWRHWRPGQCELFSGARSSTIAACFEIWSSFLPLPKIQLHRCTKMRKGAYLQSFSRKSWTCLSIIQPELCYFLRLKFSFKDMSSDRSMSSSSLWSLSNLESV
jgi:hypothetical protein